MNTWFSVLKREAASATITALVGFALPTSALAMLGRPARGDGPPPPPPPPGYGLPPVEENGR
jgi:hypothetical protein